ncbi:hypothetical protein [Halorhabdus tiamatea]|uniref:hypothetical protein n=1 Tax=Halorhabdus tiamatea TaxID=430914 RepID=UPI0011D2AB95|nr:hypothetical protein [Halorhabdus tiamatea]
MILAIISRSSQSDPNPMSFYQKFLIRTPLTGALEFARCLLESEVYSGNLDDGDLTDYEEKKFTHTDPSDPVTYGITAEQADMIDVIEADRGVSRFRFGAEAPGIPERLATEGIRVGPNGLNDATSDFDFVTDDSLDWNYASRNRELFMRL